jgi:phenylalanyl-tRNA synthetase beta chain
MLLIADAQKPIALAGVMGGANTEINAQTADILIESAYFQPANIRRTSKTLGLRSESSYRFERGTDIGIADWAGRRAAQLILQTAGGQLTDTLVDVPAQTSTPKEITLHFARTKDLLGVAIPHNDQVTCLTKLGLTDTSHAPGATTFQIPTWRVDLKREVDLIEEVGRLYGIDKIPSTPPRGALGTNPYDTVYDQISEARRILTGLGLHEAQGQTLIAGAAAALASPNVVALENPLSSDMNVLRPSLLPGLLDSLRINVSRQNADVALFEIGRVFTRTDGAPREERRVALALTGRRQLPFWSGDDRDATLDNFDLKGLAEELLEQFGIRGVVYTTNPAATPLLLESATVSLGGKLPLGELGRLLPALVKQYNLRDAVYLAEFNLDLLLSKRNLTRAFKPLPQFPSSRRDVALIVPETVTHSAVLATVKQTKPANLESVDLFDVFRGKHVPEGQQSLAYAFTYRATDKTLTDVEVNAAQEKLVAAFKTQLQATIRE